MTKDQIKEKAQAITDLCRGLTPKEFGEVLNTIFGTEGNPFFIPKKDHHKEPIDVVIPPGENPMRL